MPRLPDRFDLCVRRARAWPDGARQVDYLLGALAGLPEWYFMNVGTIEKPQAAEAELEDGRYLILFSDPGRIEELLPSGSASRVIALATGQAIPWCLARRAEGCGGLLVNPGEDAFSVALERVESFYALWQQRGGPQTAGFWIPNLTTEEEDFWREHGL